MPNFFLPPAFPLECMYSMWFCIFFFYIMIQILCSSVIFFHHCFKVLSLRKGDSVIYIFEVSPVLESFSLSVETLKVFSRQEVKSLSEIPPINSTLHADLYHPIFELNVTLSFVKICLGHLPCGFSIASLAGLPTKHQFPLSQNSFQVPQKPYKTTCLLSIVQPTLQFESK